MADEPLNTGILSPYRVVDLTDERGLLCGQILADLGADVIAVEPPGGSSARRIGPFAGPTNEADPEGSLFWWAFARGKRSITLDLESEQGRDRLQALVASADFLVESFEPGYLNGLGLGYAALAAINPRLVMVSISPFGQDGPRANSAATDLTVWASSGALLITGDEDRPPVRVPGEQAFLHAGAEAAVGALIAHVARERDGVGQRVDVSAQAASMLATQAFVLQAGWRDAPVGRMAGGIKMGPITVRLIYPCLDGYVSILFFFGSAIGPFSRRLMEWMWEEGFVDEATRDKDWPGYGALLISGKEPQSELARCIDAIARFAAGKTKQELFNAAQRRGLLIVPINTTADLVQSEHLQARDYWTPVERGGDQPPVLYPGPFAKFSATPLRYRGRAPRIGEHGEGSGQIGVQRSTGALRLAVGSREGAELGQTPSGGSASTQLPTANLPTAAPALAGVNVLEFAWVMAGPAGVRYLADYGATVVHVESGTRVDTARTLQPFLDGKAGPERSGLFANVNAGKLGITLNLRTPEARAVALRLVKWADVVVESYSPKAMRAWGLDYASLRQVNPGVIMLSSCLNGQTGPNAMLAGYGSMGAALGGFVDVVGWPDRPPSGPFSAYTDYIAPKFTAVALLAALEHRRRTGEGQYIDFSQTEAAIHFLGPTVLDYTVNGRLPVRIGNDSADHAPHGVYPSQGDDRWVAIACATEAHWQAFCIAADHPEWQRDPRFATFGARRANRELLDQEVGGWTSGLDVAAIESALQAAGVPAQRVSTSADTFDDPKLVQRGHYVTVEHPELGPVPVESSRMRFSRTPTHVTRPGPAFGQDNDHVLRELLGMGDEEIVELVASGALE